MGKGRLKIGIVAPGGRIDEETAQQVKALAAAHYPRNAPELAFHPQCFLSSGHFAGGDEARARAFTDTANDQSVDAVWFARGGYGSCRLLDRIDGALSAAARGKLYLGYSDAGALLAFLYKNGIGRAAHGPMVIDAARPGGGAAVRRALRFLVDGARSSLEASVSPSRKTAAFNITILSHLLGTPHQPDLSDHILMLEEVSEPLYRIDRALFHITSNPDIRKAAGIMLGRCGDVVPNDPAFGRTEEEIARHWCARSGIPYLGRADIGHDKDNKVVPFGRLW